MFNNKTIVTILSLWQSVVVEDHMVISQNSAQGLDFDPICAGQWRHLITEPPSHRRLSGCVGVHYAPKSVKNEFWMCDLWFPWWCLWERRQSGNECTTCRCKSSVIVRLTQAIPFLHSSYWLVFPCSHTHCLLLLLCKYVQISERTNYWQANPYHSFTTKVKLNSTDCVDVK